MASPAAHNHAINTNPNRCLYFQKPLLESGTLGAKCNTQMVIPHLSENDGASRDPPEKQVPMHTVQSFPHNIDHCLTWARSEFEGLLERTQLQQVLTVRIQNGQLTYHNPNTLNQELNKNIIAKVQV
ncbi:ubiquitin-activating enzyme E1 2 [Artemisia annua]|uniref:Ubiquitin-activating enzyme E1 2 n=1 Tax=Artemisia annua TaxID=35608 RepID=A0A2U1LCJ8_ARTAN|nr:ubiquitin-activating enzyme E1 2 [Artemisia annua]